MCAACTGDIFALIATFRSQGLYLGSRRPRAQCSIFLGINTIPNWHQKSTYIILLKTEIIRLLILWQSDKGIYFFLTQVAISFQYNYNLPLCFVSDNTILSYWQPNTCTLHTRTCSFIGCQKLNLLIFLVERGIQSVNASTFVLGWVSRKRQRRGWSGKVAASCFLHKMWNYISASSILIVS